jgi:16S rRNA (guanine(966)-N(2))-methyltransferase RsmD
MSGGKVRIVGGHWRGRHIKVTDLRGLRPTADRVRETLFNWLGQRLDGLICLDMFAGSGAIGFEALSRGAQRVMMVELNKTAFAELKNNFSQFKDAAELGKLDLVLSDTIAYSTQLLENSVDITFIDPPFSNEELFLKALTEALRVTRKEIDSAVYVEHPKTVFPEKLLTEIPKYGDLWVVGRTIRAGMANGTLLVPKKI